MTCKPESSSFYRVRKRKSPRNRSEATCICNFQMESEKGTNVVSLLSIKRKLLTTAMFITQVTKHSVSLERLKCQNAYKQKRTKKTTVVMSHLPWMS